MSHYNNIIVRLLISSRLRGLRHLILFLFIFSIAAGSVWYTWDQGTSLTIWERLAILSFFTFLLLGGCYLTIYILTPKLLLRNKWEAYFGSLVGVVLLILTIIILIQTVGIKRDNTSLDFENINYLSLFKGIMNLLSALLSFFLLFAGTSTLVLFKHWILDMKQSEELESAALQLELKLLENQINPHFLFNMLNNANIMVKKDPDVAIHIIGKLEELLRYLMNGSIQEKVSLKNEITFLNDFLELEKTRRDYFNYAISTEGEVDELQIAPLLFIIFVENAVKHNQDSKAISYVHILFKVVKGKLVFVCENSIPQRPTNNEFGGIGLVNINRRLNLLYKDDYLLEQSKTNTSYTVKLELKL